MHHILVIYPTLSAEFVLGKRVGSAYEALFPMLQILLILGRRSTRLGGAMVSMLVAVMSGIALILTTIGLLGRSWVVLLAAGVVALGVGSLSIFSIGALFIAFASVDISVAAALRTRARRMGWLLTPPMIVLGWLGGMRLLLFFDGPTWRGLVAMAGVAICSALIVVVGFGRLADHSTR